MVLHLLMKYIVFCYVYMQLGDNMQTSVFRLTQNKRLAQLPNSCVEFLLLPSTMPCPHLILLLHWIHHNQSLILLRSKSNFIFLFFFSFYFPVPQQFKPTTSIFSCARNSLCLGDQPASRFAPGVLYA